MAREELIIKRTETSKTFDNKNRTFTFEGSTGPIHYKENYQDAREEWKDIDVNHKIETSEYIEYDRMPIIVRVFKNKVGYEVIARKTGHKFKVELESEEPPKKDVEFTFNVNQVRVRLWKDLKTAKAPKKFKWKIAEENKAEGVGSLKFREKVEAFDRDVDFDKPIPESKKHTITTKKTPIDANSFYWEEIAPKTGIKIDTDVIYYSGAGDGWIEYDTGSDGSWNEAHNAIAGTDFHYTEEWAKVAHVREHPSYPNHFTIGRGFLPFLTSALPLGCIITAATLSGFSDFEMKTVQDNDAQAYVGVVQTTQPDPTELTAADFDLCGSVHNPILGANTITFTSWLENGWNVFTLDITGRGWIDRGGYTKLGLREGHDIEDDSIANDKINWVEIYLSEQGDITYDPKLSITYHLSPTIDAKTRIEKQFTQTITSKGRLQTIPAQIINSKANIKATSQQTIEAKGKITATQTKSITVKGNIKQAQSLGHLANFWDVRYEANELPTPSIVDSYSEENSGIPFLFEANTREFAQSFTGDGGILDSCKFYLIRVGDPTGTVQALLYAHTGVFGTSSAPTGDALAVSDTIDVSTISTSFTLYTFTFTGANKITLSNGTKYCIVCKFSGTASGGNLIDIGEDDTSPTHAGNAATRIGGGSWTAYSGNDLIFYVYKDEAIPPWNKGGDATTIEISPAGYLHVISSTDGLEYQINTGTDLKDAIGVTLEIRLQIVNGQVWDGYDSNGVASIDLLILNDAETARFQPELLIYSDAICFGGDPNNKYVMDTTDDYHVYRLTFKDGTANVYVDGVFRLTRTVSAAGGGDTYVTFKPENMGVAGIETSWDYVYYSTLGAFAPEPYIKAFIIKSFSQEVQAKASIKKLSTQTIDAKAKIGYITQEQTIEAKSDILIPGEWSDIWEFTVYATFTQTIEAKASIKKTLPQSIDSKANIVSLQTQTIEVKGRITTITLQTIEARGRIAITSTQTIQALGRITQTYFQTIEALGRIQILTAQTIEALGCITATNTQTIEAKAAILRLSTQIIEALARITIITEQTIDAKANIKATITRTIQAKARIALISDQFIEAKGNIKATITKVIQAKAAILRAFTQTINAKGRIQLIISQSVSAKGRITSTQTKTISAKGKITATSQQTISAKARIQKLFTQIIDAKAAIYKIATKTINAKAAIKRLFEQTIQAKARITVIYQRTIEAKANIVATQEKAIQAKGRIGMPGARTIDVKANIQAIISQAIQTKASILRVFEQTITAKGRITITISQTIEAKARITAIQEQTIQALGRITQTYPQVVDALGRIQQVFTQTIEAIGRITITATQTITAKAAILKAFVQTIEALARITITTLRSIDVKANIVSIQQQIVQAKARIQAPLGQIIDAKANIIIIQTQIVESRASIKKVFEQTINARGRIQIISEQSLTVGANIVATQEQSISAKARIRISPEQTISTKANIVTTSEQELLAKASIKKITSRTISAKARITVISQQTIDAKARITAFQSQSIEAKADIKGLIAQTISVKAHIIKVGIGQTIQAKASIIKLGIRTISAKAAIATWRVVEIIDKVRTQKIVDEITYVKEITRELAYTKVAVSDIISDRLRVRGIPRTRPKVIEITELSRVQQIKWITAKARIN